MKWGIVTLLATLFFGSVQCAFAQQHNGLKVDGYFQKENMQIQPAQPFFNLFMLVNKEERPVTVKVSFQIPMNWSLISPREQNITIPAKDTVRIPFRAASQKEVIGAIGYSIVGILSNLQNQQLTSAYFYIKVPELTNMQLFPVTRTSYFSSLKKEARFKMRLSNKGNIDELVDITLDVPEELYMDGQEEQVLRKQMMVPAGTDTTLAFDIRLKSDISSRDNEHRLDCHVVSKDNSFTTSFWFMELKSSYSHEDALSKPPLVMQVNFQNLLSEGQKSVAAQVSGDILLEASRELSYFFRHYRLHNTDDFLDYAFFNVNYASPSLDLSLGDRMPLSTRIGTGRGASFFYRINKTWGGGLTAAFHRFKPIWMGSGKIQANMQSLHTELDYTFMQNNFNNYTGHLTEVSSNFKRWGNHRLALGGGVSYTNFSQQDKSPHLGSMVRLNYNYEVPDFTARVRGRASSGNYLGSQFGRQDVNVDMMYNMTPDLRLQYSHRGYRYEPTSYINNVLRSNSLTNTQISNMKARYQVNESMQVFAGPIYGYRKSNSFYLFQEDEYAENQNVSALAGLRLRTHRIKNISISAETGYNRMNAHNITELPGNSNKTNFTHTKISMRTRFNFGGFFINYLYGPYSMNQKLSYLLEQQNTRLLRIMPYVETYFFNDIFRFTSTLNYLGNLNTNDRRLNLSNELTAFLKYNIDVRLLNTFSYQLTYDRVTNEPYKYTNTYFGLEIKKRFNFSQPRVNYHNLSIQLFKDLNGNLQKASNEPGVNNVLVKVQARPITGKYKESLKSGEKRSFNKSFLTDNNGTVEMRNLPEGIYEISLNALSNTGKYQPNNQKQTLVLDKDKDLLIPYLERNKIFGRVIINRARLSNLGKIQPSNIKITATDSRGKKFSTLTDEEGRFAIYAPSVDKYTLHVQPIDEEHFQVRKNNYKVQLNGYKTFEVNFVFDEIAPQLNLSNSNITDAQMQSVKRTNINGYIKDKNTLEPLKANIQIIDTATQRTIAGTKSSSKTGRYAVSFQTGKGYIMRVKTQGYWLHKENLNLSMGLTIQDIEKDILLESIILGARLGLSNLKFKYGSIELPLAAYAELDNAITRLKANPNVRVRVVGYASPKELEDMPGLAEDRAKQVYNYLKEAGLEQVEFKAKKPGEMEGDLAARGSDLRKVELVITDK